MHCPLLLEKLTIYVVFYAELVEIQCQQEEVNKYQCVLSETENKLFDVSDELGVYTIDCVCYRIMFYSAELSKAEEDIKKEIFALDQEKVSLDQSLCQEPEFVR